MLSLRLHTLAWRNIWRNRRRTLLTIFAVAFSSAILIFFISLQFSAFEASINATSSIYQGHLQIQKQDYNETPEIREAIERAAELNAKVSALAGISAMSFRAIGFAVASSEERSFGVQVVGVEAAREKNVSTIPGLVKEGHFLSDDSAPEVVLGRSLANNLRIKLHDDLTLIGQGQDGSVAATVLKVVGIFESGLTEFDRNLLEIPLKTFQENFSMIDQAHSLVLMGSGPRQVEDLRPDLEQIVKQHDPSLVVLNWEDLSPGLKQAMRLDMSFGWLFYTSLVLIVSFSILNTFLMSILERTREFGLIMALGMNPRQIISFVLLESLFIIAIGIISGALLGAGFVLYYGAKGFSIPGSEELMKIWHITTAVYPGLSLTSVILGPSIILVTGVLAAFLPALRVRKLEPVEAMRAV